METTEWVDADLESLIIGSLLANTAQYDHSLVKSEYFTFQAYRTIWSVAFQEWVAGKPIDIVTVSSALQKSGLLDMVGGSKALARLAADCPVAATQRHVSILAGLYQRRTTQLALKYALSELDNEKTSIKDIIGRLDQQVLDIVVDHTNTHLNKDKELDEIANKIINPVSGDCIVTAWPSLDTLIGGYRPEELVLMAGRPAMGKTALMVTAQRDLALRNIPSMTFSLDMGKKQLWSRYISQSANIAVNSLETGNALGEDEINSIRKAVDELKELPMWVDTDPYRTIGDIRMITRQMVMQHGIKIVFIDHLGKIRPEKANSREQEVSVIVQALKGMAKEFGITVVSLVQLNRQVEIRAEKRPMLSDLRESGSIEQEADIVLMAYRPEYYNINTFTDGYTNSKNRMEVIAAKVRNGSTGGVILDFHGHLTMVSERRIDDNKFDYNALAADPYFA